MREPSMNTPRIPHAWAQSWPGNCCLRCGMDDPIEDAITCPDCHVPYGPEDDDQEMRLCDEHTRLVNLSCVADPRAAIDSGGLR